MGNSGPKASFSQQDSTSRSHIGDSYIQRNDSDEEMQTGNSSRNNVQEEIDVNG